MPATNTTTQNVYKLCGTALMWLIPFSHLFLSPLLSHVFVLLPKKHKIGVILFCYLEYITSSDFP